MEFFRMFLRCVTSIFLHLTVTILLCRPANTFEYTACRWKDSKCEPFDRNTLVKDKSETTRWPRGQYALITPKEGCPENPDKGWRRGFLSFTWKHPHIFVSDRGCDPNASEVKCRQKLIPDLWPDIRSKMSGPFSRYAMRLNFCVKTDTTETDEGNVLSWPQGVYSIFGEISGCPSEFVSKDINIKLPTIYSWKTYGHLPGFAVTNNTDDKVSLVLKTCIHGQLENLTSAGDGSSSKFITDDSFVLLKSDDGSQCPQLSNLRLSIETLKLFQGVDLDPMAGERDIFTICHYQPNAYKWNEELVKYFHYPQEIFQYAIELHPFTVPDITKVIGNTSISLETLKEGLSYELPYQMKLTTSMITPWMLIDLGRNMIVTGIRFKNYKLPTVSTSYMGKLNSTIWGIPCQRWDQQFPNSHGVIYDDMFPEKSITEAANYCRAVNGRTQIWCITVQPFSQWEYCALIVFRFFPEDRPFARCFIGDDKWSMDDFGGETCLFYATYWEPDVDYIFVKEQDGRYIKLAGFPDESNERFVTAMSKVLILTSAKVSRADTLCNEDLGMADESIRDVQISLRKGSRPFSEGWCAGPNDTTPHVSVDLGDVMQVEGITVYNFERVEGEIIDGDFQRRISRRGSREILISLTNDQGETGVQYNKTFTLDKYLPVDMPQTFFFTVPVNAMFVDVYILEAYEQKCLRFELHGCRGKDFDTSTLAAVIRNDELTFNNLQRLSASSNSTSLLSTYGYHGLPGPYPAGISHMWIIDIPTGQFINLLFLVLTFNEYENGNCRDILKLILSDGNEGMHLFSGVSRLTSPALMTSQISYTALTLSSCTPTSMIRNVNTGIKAIVSVDDIPTCYSRHRIVDNMFRSGCKHPEMYVTSLSRLSYPATNFQEEWTLHVLKFHFRLQFIHFNIRCDTGSLLEITDRFSDVKTFCNLERVQPEMFSNSEFVQIKYVKGDEAQAMDARSSAIESFEMKYTAVANNKDHLINSERHHVQTIRRLKNLERFWDDKYSNSSTIAYQACSVRFRKCYFIYTGGQPSATWKLAGSNCWIRNSRLVSIHSDEEQELIKYMLRNFRFFALDKYSTTEETAFKSDTFDPNYYAHIGLSRVTTSTRKNMHLWEDGSPVTFSAWKENEPSSLRDCTRMSFHLLNTNNTWESEDCNSGLANYFVCEREITEELLGMSEWTTHLYDGELNETLSGIPCQRWDARYPHNHNLGYDDSDFPDGRVSDASNYCRDPQDNGYLWCFTLDPSVLWESCREEEVPDTVPRHYVGRLSTTLSGRSCQRWDSQIPHEHGFNTSSSFPDATFADASNYCRDPSNAGLLWCYTTDPMTVWETCNVIDTASDRCYSTHYQYMGEWSQTQSGETCQEWIAQEPHAHELFRDSQFPDGTVENAFNFCRDPYNEGYLWCFTTNPATRSEQCIFNYTTGNIGVTYNNTVIDGTFQCDGDTDISTDKLCDGIPHCVDATDEVDCVDKVHPLLEEVKLSSEMPDMTSLFSMAQCDSLEWISLLSRCDGVIDCKDASDERNCKHVLLGGSDCSKNESACDSGECIHISQLCDFIPDCTDSTDEFCDYPVCSSSEYRCRNEQCIPIENRCDAYENCLDGSDEIGCDICQSGTFHCDLQRCIPYDLVCDGYPDCEDERDEMFCYQPIRWSCEEWWFAGYRQTGVYKLNRTNVECNFDSVQNEGTIYTIFHSFEITRLSSVEVVHSTELQLFKGLVEDFFQSSSYSCEQNITQTCVPAYKAAARFEDPNHTGAYSHCECIVMKVNLSSLDGNYIDVYFCGSDIDATNLNTSLHFTYRQSRDFNRNITLSDNFPRGMQIEFGPIICKYNEIIEDNELSCDDGHVFSRSVRCVYDTDPAGFTRGCRSGKHLQGCESFECPESTVKCPGSFCLPLRFICDGQIQCPGGQDEKDCGCKDDAMEVILVYEQNNKDYQAIKSIGAQFVTTSSTVRELAFQERTLPQKLDADQIILEISDKEIDPFSLIQRQYICNYSILAFDFMKNIKFTQSGAKALIYFDNNGSKSFSNVLNSLTTHTSFLIYRVQQSPTGKILKQDQNPFVRDITVKRLSTLATLGAKYFPDICREAAFIDCPNQYKCSNSKTCIPLYQVCDGFTQCIYGDDERLCNYVCPENCSCSEYATDCSNRQVDESIVLLLNKKSRFLDLSGNVGLQRSLVNSKWRFPYLATLDLSDCGISEIIPHIFLSLVNLRSLDLSFNKLNRIPGYTFVGLRKLRYLNLYGNKNIYTFESFSLTGLSGLKYLEIRKAMIKRLSAYTFSGLNLDALNVSDNLISEVEDDAFSGLKVNEMNIENNDIENFDRNLFGGVAGVKTLYTSEFKFCCLRPNYLSEEDCYPKRDEFSSCDDLIRLPALQTMLWLVGSLSLLGNVLSIIYRLVYDRERLKFGYGIFVTNLAVSDFFMGVYLIIIAIADAVFKERYIFEDASWRSSAWCTIAGFLSTASSEASVFFLCLITLDRLVVIKFPFGQVRFDSKKSTIACCISWIISVSIGLIPIIDQGYFQGRFYSKSGVCIALPLTRDRPPGWLYAIIIFVGMNFVTFCLIAMGQTAIYFEIKKSASRVKHSKSAGAAGRRNELTIARNLLFIVATDFLCWFPIGCMGILSILGHIIPGDVYAWTAVFVLPVNSALNPVLYTLTAILGKRKANAAKMGPNAVYISERRVRPFNGMFRYFMNDMYCNPESFVSLRYLHNGDTPLGTRDAAKIALNLTRCLCLLHKNLLVVTKIDEDVVYVKVEYGKVVGDIQLRYEPTICKKRDKMGDDLYQLGLLIRILLAKRNKHPRL